MATTVTYALEQLDPRAASDEQLLALARLASALGQERTPEDPPTPLDALVRRYRAIPVMVDLTAYVARDADAYLGYVFVTRWIAEDNQHIREVQLSVHPERRRAGIGRALLRAAIAPLAGELVLVGSTFDRVPAGARFAERLGATSGLEMHVNQLELAAVDRALLEEWCALDPAGYRAEWIDADVPDALLANVIVAYDAMNNAPRGDLRFDDWRTTPEHVREFDRTRRLAGRERRLVLAIDERTGETAGYTEVAYDPAAPHVVQQQGTAVLPAHRGHGLGKWLKALMLRRVLAEWPAARFVRTGNADVNAPMLAINTRLGFRPAWASTMWQVSVGDAGRALA